MKKYRVLIGVRFGRLLVVCEAEKNKWGRRWTCICDCGKEKEVAAAHLISGKIQSCSCLHKEIVARVGRICNTTHGQKGTRIYNIWKSMRARCNNKNHKYYKYYGGREITVCEDWEKFESFYEWSKNSGYEELLTIDRIDNNDGYYPENCKWSTRKEQANNRNKRGYLEDTT